MSPSNTLGLLGLFAGVGVIISLIMTQFLIVNKSKEDKSYIWLGLMFLAIALRLSKSILYFLFMGMAPIGIAIGFLGLSSIGPLLWIYFQKNESRSFKKQWPHFIIPLSGFVAVLILFNSAYPGIFYKVATQILLVYIVLSAWRLAKNTKKDDISKRWFNALLLTAAGTYFAFLFQDVTGTIIYYAYGAAICAVVVYGLFFWLLSNPVVKKKVMELSVPAEVLTQVKKAFEKEECYKTPSFTLNELSDQLNIPSYLISKGVKELYEKTFPETVNYFRIEALKSDLVNPQNEHLKIEAMAYDVGFTTPSAFYNAFKKYTGMTPTAFQKSLVLKSA